MIAFGLVVAITSPPTVAAGSYTCRSLEVLGWLDVPVPLPHDAALVPVPPRVGEAPLYAMVADGVEERLLVHGRAGIEICERPCPQGAQQGRRLSRRKGHDSR